jgi:LysM repeat protein
MKKFVLRVLAVMMVAAMMVPSMGNKSVALAADEAVTLDLSTKGSVLNGEAPTDNADGSVTFSGGVTMKCTFPLPTTLAAGESVKVNVKLQFNSDADAGVRFYLVNGVDVNIATDIVKIANEATGTVVEQTFTLTAASDATELLFASSGYGVFIDNVTLLDITLGDKPAEVPATDFVALNIAERVFVSGDAPADNADGSITFSDGKSMKCSFALPETLVAGDSITVNVKAKFDSADDAGIRFYLISNGVDVNIATDIVKVANEATGTVVEQTFQLTAASDATELLLASSSYGVYMNNVTIYDITLGDKPVVEEPVVEEPVVEEPVVEEPKEEPTVEVTGDEYVVKAGDTLTAIAKACDLTVQELVDANGIKDPDVIRKGAKLIIPTVDTTKRYVVKSGDTLSKIAKMFDCTVADLVEANDIENADLIQSGQLIILP